MTVILLYAVIQIPSADTMMGPNQDDQDEWNCLWLYIKCFITLLTA